jgi:hypothetical protein
MELKILSKRDISEQRNFYAVPEIPFGSTRKTKYNEYAQSVWMWRRNQKST